MKKLMLLFYLMLKSVRVHQSNNGATAFLQIVHVIRKSYTNFINL